MALMGSALAAAIVFACASLCLLFAATSMKLRREQMPKAPPWGQGWLARILLAVLLPLAVVLAGLVMTVTPARAESSMVLAAYGGMAAIGLCEIVLLVLVLKRLHRASDETTGELTGILRFIFTARAAWKAWTRKYVMAAMLGQLALLGCCFLIAIIVYKPVFGAHPWQTDRFKIGSLSREATEVTRLTKELESIRLSRYGGRR
jgi:Na+/proline symporter